MKPLYLCFVNQLKQTKKPNAMKKIVCELRANFFFALYLLGGQNKKSLHDSYINLLYKYEIDKYIKANKHIN